MYSARDTDLDIFVRDMVFTRDAEDLRYLYKQNNSPLHLCVIYTLTDNKACQLANECIALFSDHQRKGSHFSYNLYKSVKK